MWKREGLKSKKQICSKVSINSPGIRAVSLEEEKEGYGGKDLQKRKVLSREWKEWGVMDDESGESMELMKDSCTQYAGSAGNKIQQYRDNT